MIGVTSITDLHLRKANTKTEPNLLASQKDLMKMISNVCYQNSLKYDEHIIIFYGDICDRQLAEIPFVQVTYWLKELSLHSKLYVIRGNHETTYKGKFNVFWHVTYGMGMENVEGFTHIDNLLEFANSFQVGGTKFILNHNNSVLTYDDDATVKNIVIATHNAITMPELEQMLNEDITQDPKSNYVKYTNFKDFLPRVDKIRYVMAGHLHSLYGQYRIEERFNGIKYDFIMYYLASLGRPKSNEIDENVQRDLPTFEIDGDSLRLVHNYIYLEGRETLDEEEIGTRKDKYVEGKHIKNFKKLSFSKEDVMSDLHRLYSMNISKNLIFTNALEEKEDNEIAYAVNTIKDIDIFN